MPKELGYADGLGCSIEGGALDVPSVSIGCVTHDDVKTGVTLILFPPGSCGAVDVAGGAPATRETEVLRPENLVPGPDAVLLTGGSAYGLRAADGAMQVLAQAGRGVSVGAVRVPIVPAAAIFDLGVGAAVAPSAEDGATAARFALEGSCALPEGRFGAGCGATVGKALGAEHAMHGGQGAVTLVAPDGLRVGAVAVVNALGSVVAKDGTVLAGPLGAGGAALRTTPLLAIGEASPGQPGEATTIACVATNARLQKSELQRVARMAHDGLGQAVEPAHTLFDGDTIFCISCGDLPADPSRVGALAAAAVAEAIRRAVL
ncbi:MAG: P1 family peptidase [Thermaerobacter sp.]|nr:P1 family peptidase [Thermaerobacter sp.]